MSREEAKMIEQENNNVSVLTAFNKIPYALINAEVTGTAKETLDEFTKICKLYEIYKKGAEFNTEGSNSDYVPAQHRYKMAASLINKEARFLFAEAPDIVVEPKGDVGKSSEDAKDMITIMNDLVKTIFDRNLFEEQLIKAAKDCFIGKRVAGLVNFNEEDGVTISFLPSTQFIYETKAGNPRIVTKFVAFIIIKNSNTLSEKKIFKKKYELVDDVVYLEETLYNGAGTLIEEVTHRQEILLDEIPVAIFVNDGLTGESDGESEIEQLVDDEAWFSKLANADIDAQRKSMNPTKYTVDMDSNSTKGLSTAAGAFWDLGSDQNLDKPAPQVGMLEPSMSYSTTLDTTLKRIKKSAYDRVDMPDIEEMQASITSGKALKAIYWGLIVRCKEKMKMWGPQLRNLTNIIIKGALVYPNCIVDYTNDVITPVDYEISVVQNIPIPEDEVEEKNMDLSEVEANVMSKKAYMKKWRGLTDDEVQEELEQMAMERQILEDSAMGMEEDMSMDEDIEGNEGEGFEDDEELDDGADDIAIDDEDNSEIDGLLADLDNMFAQE